jgi:hypothetical protein
MNTLNDVLTEWQSNPAFKEQFQKNPEKALTEANLVLNPTDLAKIKKMLKIEDGPLDDRINK